MLCPYKALNFINLTALASKNRRYLSGFDWVMSVIDYLIKKTTAAGNASQVVLMLDGQVEEAALRSCLGRLLNEFPLLQGKVARDYTLLPYWRIPSKYIENDLNLSVYHCEDLPPSKSALSLMEDGSNRPFKRENQHLAFHLVYTKNRQSWLAMTFDHRLLDARGAEAFIDLFQQYFVNNGNSMVTKDVCLTAPADLDNWKHKFSSGKTINRRLIALSKTSIRRLPVPDSDIKRGFKFHLICFDQKETKQIYENAYAQAGYLMEMPYLFATVTQIIHELFEKKGISGDSYMVPVSIDMRSAKDIKKELFFNYVSMFFFQIRVEFLKNRKILLKEIKRQMYEQVQLGIPAKLMEASALLRIAPLPILNRLFQLPVGGNIASFCCSNVGKSSYRFPDLMGTKIKNIFHMPRIPVPPGLGIFFNSFNGQLNAIITWLDGLLSDKEVDELKKNLINKL